MENLLPVQSKTRRLSILNLVMKPSGISSGELWVFSACRKARETRVSMSMKGDSSSDSIRVDAPTSREEGQASKTNSACLEPPHICASIGRYQLLWRRGASLS